MIVLDTTVLVDAVGADHPLLSPCRGLMELLRDGAVRATTTLEVVQEFTHVRARRRTGVEAAQRATEYARALRPLLRPDEDDLGTGLEVFAGSAQLGPFDAVLAASAIRRGWALVAADRWFAHIAG
ncbi:MAG: type II toxin-antitoxin system VapC family toxin, partial [Chloroflexi bacterium]|nr:type II toxin-antitoxin system VapC family toxin [Chloroflexota bacterium]